VLSGEDLGELGDVAGECVQVRAAGLHLAELCLLVVEGIRVAQHPAGDVADLGRAGLTGGAAARARKGCR
jgi:hypothetical protein